MHSSNPSSPTSPSNSSTSSSDSSYSLNNPKSDNDIEVQLPVENSGQNLWKRYCRCYWVMPVTLTVLLVILLTMMFALHPSGDKNAKLRGKARLEIKSTPTMKSDDVNWFTRPMINVSVCRTPVCNVLGQTYAKTINLSADPCNDFYTFTCAGLQKDYDLKKLLMDPRTLSNLYRLRAAMKDIGYVYLNKVYNQSLDPAQQNSLAASDKQMARLYGSCVMRNSDEQVAESVRRLKALFVDARLRWFDQVDHRMTYLRGRKKSDRDSPLLYTIGRLSLHWGLTMPWLSFRLVSPGVEGIVHKIIEIKGMFKPTEGPIQNRRDHMNLNDVPSDYWNTVVQDALRKSRLCLAEGKNKSFVESLKPRPEYRLMLTKTAILLESLGVSLNSERLSDLALHQLLGERCLSNLAANATPVEGKIHEFERATGISLLPFLNRQLAGLVAISSTDELVFDDVTASAVGLELAQNPSGSEDILEDCVAMWLVKMLSSLIGGPVTMAACLINDRKPCHTRDRMFCEATVYEYLPLSGAALIGRHIVSEFGFAELRAIIDLVKVAIAQIIVALGWMDEATKNRAMKKLSDTWAYFGYPDHFNQMDYAESAAEIGDNFFGNLLNIKAEKIVSTLMNFDPSRARNDEGWPKTRLRGQGTNAAYVFRSNRVLVPSSSLGLSHYVEGAPTWINIASSPIGNEILHSFGDSRSHFNRKGKQNKWWSESTTQTFKKSVSCLADQYSVPVPFHEHLKFNGSVSLAENLADNGGLRALYRAFQLAAYMKGGHLEILPGFERFTPNQMFFVAWAYKRCRVTTPDQAINAFRKQTYTYDANRVNIPLMNFDEFGKAFNCPVGSPMRPQIAARCSAW